MKHIFVLFAGTLIAVLWLMNSCADEGVNGPKTDPEQTEELAELINSEIERFHRLGLEHIVAEMELKPGSRVFDSGLEAVMEQIGHHVNMYAENFDWQFDADLQLMDLTNDDTDAFLRIFGADQKSWFSIFKESNKPEEKSNDDLIDFIKIEYFSGLIGDIMGMDSGHQCVEKHIGFLTDELLKVREMSKKQLNEYDWFIIDNMISVGLSSFISWIEITAEWAKSTKDGGGEEGQSINWEGIGNLAKYDLVSGALGCLAKHKVISTATVLGGIKGFMASAGSLFGWYALYGSIGYATYELINEEAPENNKNKTNETHTSLR